METVDFQTNETASWAKPTATVRAPVTPARILNINVDGRDITGPLQGFGPMRHKSYKVEIGAGHKPVEVVSIWKDRFSEFWPAGSDIYMSSGTIVPGKVGIINLPAPLMPIRLATGIVVIYADDTSFTFITIQGHMFTGINNFSAFESNGVTTAQVDVLIRTSDPLWEAAMRMFGFRREDDFWRANLCALAKHFGVSGHPVMTSSVVDYSMQWLRALNVRYNAAILSGLCQLAPGWPRIARLLGL